MCYLLYMSTLTSYEIGITEGPEVAPATKLLRYACHPEIRKYIRGEIQAIEREVEEKGAFTVEAQARRKALTDVMAFIRTGEAK